MTNVIRLLQDLSNGIRRTFVRHFARFQLTRPGAREVSTSCVSHMASAERDPIMEVWCGARVRGPGTEPHGQGPLCFLKLKTIR